MPRPFRFFDHTGDFGVELTADDPEQAAERFVEAFNALTLADPARVGEGEQRALEVRGLDDAAALIALGNELIFLFESEGFLARRLEAETLEDGVLRGVLVGEAYDPGRHEFARPVKAVTHHQAELSWTDDERVFVRVVFDL